MKGFVKLLRNTFFKRQTKKKNRYGYVYGNEINQIAKHLRWSEDFSDAMGYTITGAIKPWVAPLKKRY